MEDAEIGATQKKKEFRKLLGDASLITIFLFPRGCLRKVKAFVGQDGTSDEPYTENIFHYFDSNEI